MEKNSGSARTISQRASLASARAAHSLQPSPLGASSRRRTPPHDRLPHRSTAHFLAAALAARSRPRPRPNTFSTAGFSANAAPRSPVVAADRSITFAFRAPAAREVMVNFGEWSPQIIPLVRDAGGWWTGRVGPVEPGIYEYVFVVDGTPAIDPLNSRIKAGTVVYSSTVEVAGATPRFDEIQTSRRVPSISSATARRHRTASRRSTCICPPRTRVIRRAAFRVLYLRHGGGDDDPAGCRTDAPV